MILNITLNDIFLWVIGAVTLDKYFFGLWKYVSRIYVYVYVYRWWIWINSKKINVEKAYL